MVLPDEDCIASVLRTPGSREQLGLSSCLSQTPSRLERYLSSSRCVCKAIDGCLYLDTSYLLQNTYSALYIWYVSTNHNSFPSLISMDYGDIQTFRSYDNVHIVHEDRLYHESTNILRIHSSCTSSGVFDTCLFWLQKSKSLNELNQVPVEQLAQSKESSWDLNPDSSRMFLRLLRCYRLHYWPFQYLKAC